MGRKQKTYPNLFLALWLSLSFGSAHGGDCVILLHGLARTHESMNPIADRLSDAGLKTVNMGYPSRKYEISELSEMAIPMAHSHCESDDAIYFVTHSMGGILVRDYYARHKMARRPDAVVMLAPPNHGSEIIDQPAYEKMGSWLNGPAGYQLSARPNSFVNSLPEPDYPVGIIAGNRSIEPYHSRNLPGQDDGKVSIASTRLNTARDWLVISANHSFIMMNELAIEQVLSFIQTGQFRRP